MTEYRYIVIDDEVLIRKGLISKIQQITSLAAVCIGEAANGIEGMEMIAASGPDIVITDMKMKKMDGIEFLERVSEKYPELPVIVISGYKAFDYVNKAIEKRAVGYVLKPFSTEEIEKQLLLAVDQIERQKNLKLLKEKAEDFEQRKEQDILLSAIMEPWNEGVEKELLEKGYCMEDYHILISIYTDERNAPAQARALCGQHLSDISYWVLENPLNKQLHFILLSCQDEKIRTKMENKARHISGYLMQQAQVKSLICISRCIRGFAGLNKCFKKNTERVKDAHLTDRRRLFWESEDDSEGVYPEEFIQDLFLKMKYDADKARQEMEKFFDGIDIREYSLRAIGRSCESILSKINQYAVQMGVDTDDIMALFYRRYLYCSDIDKMKKEISGYVALIFHSITMKSPDQNKLFVDIEKYIRENYHQKLTLQLIASKFYVTPAYCSSLLKEKLNKSFNEYLGEIRIERARQLLLGTQMSVDSISNEIGYSNPKYFFKVFKKMTGYTPLEYRGRRTDDAL